MKTTFVLSFVSFVLLQFSGCGGDNYCVPIDFTQSSTGKSNTSEVYGGNLKLGQVAVKYFNHNPTINRVKIVGVVPNESSARKVLGQREVSASDLQLLDDTTSKIEGFSDSVVTRRNDGIEVLGSSMSGDQGELVVLIGHSEKTRLGRKFYFPNGDGHRLETLHEYAREHNTQLLILTCKSPDINAYRALSIAEATEIARKMQALGEAGATKEELVKLARSELLKRDAKLGICYVLATGSGAGIVVSLFEDEDSEDN